MKLKTLKPANSFLLPTSSDVFRFERETHPRKFVASYDQLGCQRSIGFCHLGVPNRQYTNNAFITRQREVYASDFRESTLSGQKCG